MRNTSRILGLVYLVAKAAGAVIDVLGKLSHLVGGATNYARARHI